MRKATPNLHTALSERINKLRLNGELSPSLTQNQFVYRARSLPLLAAESLSDENQFASGFAVPINLSTLDLRGMGFVGHGFSPRDKKSLSEPISLLQHMLLLAYEATPRPMSFAMNGYSASDFVAYAYQDVAARFIDIPLMHELTFTREKASIIKSWLSESVPRKQNSPQRHIRRRLMAIFNRSSQQINSLFIDREIPPEMILLFRKLLERGDNLGYTGGSLRDFKLVRSDLNLLAESVTLPYLMALNEVEQVDAFNRVDCPATVDDFSSLQIDKPRSTSKNKKIK